MGEYRNQECFVCRCPLYRSPDWARHITTIPPATMDAFRDHGRVRMTLGTEEEEVEAVLATAAALGIDVHAITEQLQADGIAAFASSFDQLVVAVGRSGARFSRLRADVNPLAVFMIGHSIRTAEGFVRLLKAQRPSVIDVQGTSGVLRRCDCSGLLNCHKVARVRQVVARADRRDDLLERLR